MILDELLYLCERNPKDIDVYYECRFIGLNTYS